MKRYFPESSTAATQGVAEAKKHTAAISSTLRVRMLTDL
jgi:hypothetical protein